MKRVGMHDHSLFTKSLFTMCVLFAVNFISESYEEGSDEVTTDYLVVFHSFYLKSQRHHFINHSIELHNRNSAARIRFSFVDRNNRAYESIPSDFEIVRVLKVAEKFSLASLKHRLIKSVAFDRVIKLNSKTKKTHRNSSFSSRSLLKDDSSSYASKKDYPKYLSDARRLHKVGETGSGVSVAVFDTGITSRTKYLANVKSKSQWTDDKKSTDMVGHGTFVASVIASTDPKCPGVAPDVDIHIFKVFNKKKISRTSWFLDAFNYAISMKVDVINLSIGGPDFEDRLFVDKVSQIVASGIAFVSAIGNDGPVFGTLNNPADQAEVIGVGAVDQNDVIASFSSRGMTSWELPSGTGRVKPDLVVTGTDVRGHSIGGICTTMRGTSVASPIVAGSVALLISAARRRSLIANPPLIKQMITSSAEKLQNSSMCEQGNGKLNLISAFENLRSMSPDITLFPSELDMTDNSSYAWPLNAQSIYFTGAPTMVNVTITNSMNIDSRMILVPIWSPTTESAQKVSMSFDYPAVLWPWGGYLGIRISVLVSAKNFSGIVAGLIRLNIHSKAINSGMQLRTGHEVVLPVKLKVIPAPKRDRRILWDQFHSLKYPNGYFPRDDLSDKRDMLDWHADHPHTNFRSVFDLLVNAGFYVEILSSSLNCFDATNYQTLIIIDSEDYFTTSEIEKLHTDVTEKGLSVFVVSEWWNLEVMDKIKYFDENTRMVKAPLTGGSNVPALNWLLSNFQVALSDHVYNGQVSFGTGTFELFSAGSILSFPENGYLLRANLEDEAAHVLNEKRRLVEGVPIAGFVDLNTPNSGRLAVLTDSSCLEDTGDSKSSKKCYELFLDMLNYTTMRTLNETIFEQFRRSNLNIAKPTTSKTNLEKSELILYSRSKLRNSSGVFDRSLNCPYVEEWLSVSNNEVPISRALYENMKERLELNLSSYVRLSTENEASILSGLYDGKDINVTYWRKYRPYNQRVLVSESQNELTILLSIVSLSSLVIAVLLFRAIILRKRKFRVFLRRAARAVSRLILS